MDEKQFFEHQDKKFEAIGLLLGDLTDTVQKLVDDNVLFSESWRTITSMLNKIVSIVEIKGIVQANLADFSDKPKAKRSYDKPMPKQIGDWIIGKKGCNSCGGDITWDNYNPQGHPYPDHVDENGNLVDCPNYQPND